MELVTVVLGGLLDFAVAIVITAGLDHTCKAFDDVVSEKSGYVYIICDSTTKGTVLSSFPTSRCPNYYLRVEDEHFRFYHYINTSKVKLPPMV